jgi:recombination associated protein RdgC
MLFKQIQLFQLTNRMPSSANVLAERLHPLAFRPCLPSMPSSMGWVSPIDEDDMPLVRGMNGCFMICLQIEEKMLPASVIAQTLKEKIKKIELSEARKVHQKEKLSFKDEVTHTLLPRAFSKFSRIQAYIDTRHQWLVLNTTSPTKTELFISMFKKSLGDGIHSFDVVKPSSIITHWLQNQDYPSSFSIEKFCVLQDPNQQNRMIRCQQQDLFVSSIQSFIKDGFETIQTALCWQDRINFIIADDFALRSIGLADEDMIDIKDDLETKQQKFDADFLMMTESLAGLLNDLLTLFHKNNHLEIEKKNSSIII